MKKLYIIFLLYLLIFCFSSVQSQTINWASLNKENKYIFNANFGAECGVIYGLGYGYPIRTKLFPTIANIEYSFPSGNKVFDDFKVKIGGEIRWVEFHSFQFSTIIQGVFRRYENDFVRLVNFGSDISGIVGYYRPKWFVASEVGFDKAIVTNFKHSNAYKNQYSSVVDGWYEPSTGGIFYYGLQAGFSFRGNDIYVRAGKMLTQDFKTSPMIPMYVRLGYNLRVDKIIEAK